MGSIKDRNSIDLTVAEDIKKRWQEYTHLYKNDLNDPDNHDGVITHLAQLASIRQMSGQVSPGSAGEYQADERAGVARLSWRVSGR